MPPEAPPYLKKWLEWLPDFLAAKSSRNAGSAMSTFGPPLKFGRGVSRE
jgi:hypothetical protein